MSSNRYCNYGVVVFIYDVVVPNFVWEICYTVITGGNFGNHSFDASYAISIFIVPDVKVRMVINDEPYRKEGEIILLVIRGRGVIVVDVDLDTVLNFVRFSNLIIFSTLKHRRNYAVILFNLIGYNLNFIVPCLAICNFNGDFASFIEVVIKNTGALISIITVITPVFLIAKGMTDRQHKNMKVYFPLKKDAVSFPNDSSNLTTDCVAWDVVNGIVRLIVKEIN